MTRTLPAKISYACIGALTVLFVSSPILAEGPTDKGFDRLSDPLRHLNRHERKDFEAGLEVFQRDFGPPPGGGGPPKGGGPLRNTFGFNSCQTCHTHVLNPETGLTDQTKDGGGHATFRAHQATAYDETQKTCDHLADRGGPGFQVNLAALPSMGLFARPQESPGPYADFNGEYIPLVSQNLILVGPRDDRTTNDLFGLGLLDALTDREISKRADPHDSNGDGISGRVHWVTDHHGETHAGKNGRKAEVAHLDEFNAEAFQNEQGVTSKEFPDDGVLVTVPFPGAPTGPVLTITPLVGLDGFPDPEVSDKDLKLLNAYVRFLAQPEQKRVSGSERRVVRKGERIFKKVGCASCHTPSMRTGRNKSRALSRKKIKPYSDMLLHDMGPLLAEGCKGDATPSEWRTEPLWGLRFVAAVQGGFPPPQSRTIALLHDGRAGSIDEAIQWHDGEAERARNKYNALSDKDREMLLKFLNTL